MSIVPEEIFLTVPGSAPFRIRLSSLDRTTLERFTAEMQAYQRRKGLPETWTIDQSIESLVRAALQEQAVQYRLAELDRISSHARSEG